MNRREFLQVSSAAGAALGISGTIRAATQSPVSDCSPSLLAGFAHEKITPPLGTRMMGFGFRDFKQGCQSIHDDVHVRALFLRQGDERLLILAYDLCFVGREEADRFKGALGREFDLSPRQILLNTSHNHAGPMVGTWYWAGVFPPDRPYIKQLERATLSAARNAHDNMREATMLAQTGTTTLPMSRRLPDDKGKILFAPNPDGEIHDRLPLCMLKDKADKPICLMFSVSAHPSMVMGWDISAEYPGVACRLLDERLGSTAAMFLQGCGGDANTRIMGEGADKKRKATWEEVDKAGRLVADETLRTLDKGLVPVAPNLRSVITELRLPLQKLPPRSEFEEIASKTKPEARDGDMRYQWATQQLALLDRSETLPTSAGVIVQEMRLGNSLRIVGIEGETVAAWGKLIEGVFGQGATFPLGYCNGQGLYLPVSRMLPEGGYEVESYWEYGLAAPLAPGLENIVTTALANMHRQIEG